MANGREDGCGWDIGRGKVGSGSLELGATAGSSAKSDALAERAGTGQVEADAESNKERKGKRNKKNQREVNHKY